jgi:hypothetical protein
MASTGKEQNQLFPRLRQADLDLDTLGAKLAQRKAELFQELAEGGEVT